MSETSHFIDNHGRRIRKLRVSLLDRCNFRCLYCMPVHAQFKPRSSWLDVEEIHRLCSTLVSFGIEEIRLTGGEPTLRPDFVTIAERLSQLPLQKLGLTTNGFLLNNFLNPLRATQCQYINFSLDSLNSVTFHKLARFDGFSATIKSILRAKELGFQVKINTVMMRGINDGEIENFAKFSRDQDIEVRFLELMSIGEAAPLRAQHFISASEILSQLRKNFDLIEIKSAIDSTSVRYQTTDGVQIGMIAPVTQSFCNNCSRWRLTADGFLHPCLMSTQGLLLKNKSEKEIHEVCQTALGLKPYVGNSYTPILMHSIGG